MIIDETYCIGCPKLSDVGSVGEACCECRVFSVWQDYMDEMEVQLAMEQEEMHAMAERIEWEWKCIWFDETLFCDN